MKRILLSAVAFGAMTAAAMAEPQKMTEDQMADVAGGVSSSVWQNNHQVNSVNALALDLSGLGGANATATGSQDGQNVANINGTETVTNPALPQNGFTETFSHGFNLGSSNLGGALE